MIPVEKMSEEELKAEEIRLEKDLNDSLITYETAERLYFIRRALKRIQSARKNSPNLE